MRVPACVHIRTLGVFGQCVCTCVCVDGTHLCSVCIRISTLSLSLSLSSPLFLSLLLSLSEAVMSFLVKPLKVLDGLITKQKEERGKEVEELNEEAVRGGNSQSELRSVP